MTYKIIDDKTVMTGFDGLKFVGKDAIPEIIEKRPFTSIEDFLTKVDGKKVRSNTVQALAASGSLDSFNVSRRVMFLYASDYKKKLTEYLKRKKKNPDIKDFNYPWPKDEKEWNIPEVCALERRYIGESLCGDKFKEYEGFFTRNAPAFNKLEDILPMPPTNMSEKDLRKYTAKVNSIQAEVVSFFEFKVKKEGSNIKGQTMSKVILEDPYNNRITMTCFPDSWDVLQSRCLQLSGGKYKIEPRVALYLNCNVNWYEGELSLLFGELCKFAPPPQIPIDLVAKKVSLPRVKKESDIDIDRDTLLDQIEEDLIDEGNSELGEYDDDDEDSFPSFKDFK
jgi:DNA polymerase III alpha subunit